MVGWHYAASTGLISIKLTVQVAHMAAKKILAVSFEPHPLASLQELFYIITSHSLLQKVLRLLSCISPLLQAEAFKIELSI